VDAIKLLNELEDYIETRRHLGGICIDFHRDDLLTYTQKIRAAIPEDVKKGAKVTAEKDRVLEKAKERADQTVEDAQSEAKQITRDSRASAEKMIRDAEAEAARILSEAKEAASKLTAETIADSEELMNGSRAKAEQMLRDAHQQSQQMITQSEVTRLANAQAREIVSPAEYDAKALRRGAAEYAQGVMVDLERHMSDIMATIERGRAKLDQRVRAHEDRANSNGRGELTGANR